MLRRDFSVPSSPAPINRISVFISACQVSFIFYAFHAYMQGCVFRAYVQDSYLFISHFSSFPVLLAVLPTVFGWQSNSCGSRTGCTAAFVAFAAALEYWMHNNFHCVRQTSALIRSVGPIFKLIEAMLLSKSSRLCCSLAVILVGHLKTLLTNLFIYLIFFSVSCIISELLSIYCFFFFFFFLIFENPPVTFIYIFLPRLLSRMLFCCH